MATRRSQSRVMANLSFQHCPTDEELGKDVGDHLPDEAALRIRDDLIGCGSTAACRFQALEPKCGSRFLARAAKLR